MGKRRSNDRQKLAGKIGVSKVRYCLKHNELTKAVRMWPARQMMYHCSQGCKLDKGSTILKVPEGVQRPR
jgi:hypothetical protein